MVGYGKKEANTIMYINKIVEFGNGSTAYPIIIYLFLTFINLSTIIIVTESDHNGRNRKN